jgi:hypothetical protein
MGVITVVPPFPFAGSHGNAHFCRIWFRTSIRYGSFESSDMRLGTALVQPTSAKMTTRRPLA